MKGEKNMEETKEIELYNKDSAEFCELIDSVKVELRNTNKDYKKLLKDVVKIKENYPNIQSFMEDGAVLELQKDECKMLQKVLDLYQKMHIMEEEKIFFLGAKENYFYCKKLNILKETP